MIGPKKKITIGITVNLENYENIRLEIEGEAAEVGDAEELIRFLDGLLARLGRGDDATAERVDAYRRRVFALGKAGGGAYSATPGEMPAVTPPARNETPQTPIADAGHEEAGPPAGTPAGVEETTAAPSGEAGEVPEPRERAQVSLFEEEATGAVPPGTVVCEECGAEVPPAQQKVSNMFVGRILCKTCMPKF